MTRYFIDRFFAKPIALEIEGVPPCMRCGIPVERPSMDGPLVCGPCDMGKRQDGTPKTEEDYERDQRHRAAMIERYEVKPH